MSALPKSNIRLQPEKIEQIFSWCEKTFVEQTVKNFSQQISSVLDEIKIIADETSSYQEKQVYHNLHHKLFENKEEMRESFGIFLKQYFEEKIIPVGDFYFNAADLKIVSENEIDSKIATQNLKNYMNKEIGEEVKNLSERMEFLLGKDKNPFSTDVLASALTSALEQVLQDIVMQKQAITLFGKQWPDSIKNTYEGLNHFLIDNDVLVNLGENKNYVKREKIDIAAAKSALFQQAFGQQFKNEAEQYNHRNDFVSETNKGMSRINLPPLPKVSHQEVVEMFTSLINKNINNSNLNNSLYSLGSEHSGVFNFNRENNPMQMQQVSEQTLNTIKDLNNQLTEYSKLNTNSPIASGVVGNILDSGLSANSLQLTNILKNLSRVTENKIDKTIIDLVSVVFDNLFSLSNVPDHVKFLIGKLQIPILKTTLNDQKFFTEKESSVRIFLTKITKKETAYNDASMSRFEQIIESILKEENISSETFDNAIASIDKLIELENKKEEIIIQKSSEALEQTEKCSEHLEQLIIYTKSMTDKINYEPLKVFIEKIWAPNFAKKWSSIVPKDAQSFVRGLNLEAKVQLNHGLIVFDMLSRSLMVKNPNQNEIEQLRLSIPKIRDGLNKVCFDLRISNEDAQGLGFLLAEKHLFLIQREEQKRNIHEKNIKENESNIIANYKNKETVEIKVKNAEVEINSSESNFNIIFVKGAWFRFKEENINMKLLWVSPKRTLFLFSSPKNKKVFSFDKSIVWDKYKKKIISFLPVEEIDTESLIGNALNDLCKR